MLPIAADFVVQSRVQSKQLGKKSKFNRGKMREWVKKKDLFRHEIAAEGEKEDSGSESDNEFMVMPDLITNSRLFQVHSRI